jgi:hypothetical protein
MAVNCSKCSSVMSDDDAFCGFCGQSTNGNGGYPSITMEPVPSVAAVNDGPSVAWPPSSVNVPSTSMPQAGPAVGQAEPNAMYMGLRLQYQAIPEPTFDPLGNVRFLFHMWVRFALYTVVYGFGALIGVLICGLTALAISAPAGLTLFVIAAVVAWLVLAACFLFLKIPIQLSEWKISIDNKAAAVPMAFEHIAWVLRGRAVPLDSLQVRRLSLPGGDGVRDYLELRRGIFTGYVACFGYGHDLYVGWTFWITLSPFQYAIMIIVRIWHSLINRGSDLYTSFRYDSARAMRETMHSAAREGVDVAIGQLTGQGQGLVGSVIGVAESIG